MARLAALSLLGLLACGGDAPTAGAGLRLSFSLSRGGTAGLAACKDFREVSGVEVRVFGIDGVTPILGYPKPADCATGSFEDPAIPDGTYTLELVAKGTLAGEAGATLFKLRRPLNLPADAQLELALSPEVAFLSLSWSFAPGGDLAPCADEVDTVSIFLSTGAAGSGSYSKTDLACTLGAFTVPTPLFPQSYTVKLEAYAQGTGRKLYGVDETRLLERGVNPAFAVLFSPLGGRLLFDWQFAAPGGGDVAACDDARIGVTELSARLVSLEGDDPIELRIPCASGRPFVVPRARFTAGRQLELTLVGEGVERYYVRQPILTRSPDTDLGLLRLKAVGSATVTVARAAMSACPADLEGLHVGVRPAGAPAALVEGTLPVMGGTLPVSDVPLGDYDVSIDGMKRGASVCSASRRASITQRSNLWSTIEL